MECRIFDERISLYIDNQLNEIEHKEFELHLMKCENCRESYEDMLDILVELKKEEEVDLPQNYKTELRDKLREASKGNKKYVNWKPISALAAGLIVLVVSIGLILNNNIMDPKERLMTQMDNSTSQMEMYSATEETRDQSEIVAKDEINKEENFKTTALEEAVAPEDNIEMAQIDRGVVSRYAVNGKRNLKEAYIDIQIVKYDSALGEIEDFVKTNNGYVENSQTGFELSQNSQGKVKLKEGNVRIRVPQDRFEDTINFLKGLGMTINEQVYEVDISQDYIITENNVKNLQIQEERLKEILDETKEVEDILQVENELKRVRSEIDTNKESLKNLDNNANMTTITANIREVESSKSFSNLAIIMITASLILIVAVLITVWRKIRS